MVQRTKLWKSVLMTISIFVVVCALAGFTSVVRSSFAEAKENATFREIARNNAALLEESEARNEETLRRMAAMSQRLEDRREAVEKIVTQVEYVRLKEDCEIPPELWRILDDAAG